MRFRKLIWSGFLAVTMTLSGVMPQTILAANETGLKNNVNIAESIQDADPAETEEPVFTAPEGTYVPGEVIVCVKEAAFDEKRIASQVNGSAFGRLFGAKPDLSSEELMDVSHAAAEIENEKKGIDQEGPVATGQAPEKTVLKAVHSDTLSTEELMKLYSDQPGVVFVEPNYIFSLEEAEEPPIRESMEQAEASRAVPTQASSQEIPDLTGFQFAFGNGDGGIDVPDWNNKARPNAEGVVVAVLDTGVDYNHPDLQNVMWDEGLNYPELTALGGGKYGINYGCVDWKDDPALCHEMDNPMDIQGHGTHCAGIIGAEWNDFGVSGAASGVRIMALNQCTNTAGGSTYKTALLSFNYLLTAKKAGINLKAVNCSWGANEYFYSEVYAVRELGDAGVVSVFATGNDHLNLDTDMGTSTGVSSVPSVINVNSNTEKGEISSFSNYGSRDTYLFSPGTKILSTYPTFMAAAIPIEDVSKPVKTDTGKEVSDDYSTEDTFFTYEVNPALGATLSLDTEEKLLKVENVDLTKNNDEISVETLGEGQPAGITVPLTLSANAPIPRPSDGGRYNLVVGAISERSAYYIKVYVRTVDGRWERPGFTSVTEKEESFNTYPLDKGMNGGEFDLENLQIRLVAHDIRFSEEKTESADFALTRIWITDKEQPFKYLDGTSMATPAVTGEAAVLAAAFPDDSAEKIAARVIAGARKSPYGNYDGLCITEGMANVRNSLNEAMYTPVLNSLWADDEGLHLEGYFFGAKQNVTVRLSQGNNTWSNDAKNGESALFIERIEKDKADPDHAEIVMELPENLRGDSEVYVTVVDEKKPADRQSASRYLILTDPDRVTEPLYSHVSFPEDQQALLTPMQRIFSVGTLDRELFLSGVVALPKLEYYTLRYDGRTLSKLDSPIRNVSNMVSWNRFLVYLTDNTQRTLTFHNGNEVVRELQFCPITEEVSEEDAWVMDHLYLSDECALYYDGVDLLLFRSHASIDGMQGTAVYRVDPFTAMGDYLGKLIHYTDRDIVISHMETGSSNTIYVFGSDSMNPEAGLHLERFTVDGFAPENVELPSLPEGLVTRDANGLIPWNGCGVEGGMLFAGPYIMGNNETGSENTLIAADNFFLDLNHIEDGIRPMRRRIGDRRVYRPVVTASQGEVWFLGKRLDGYYLARTQADTFPAYGDEAVYGSDMTDVTDVRVKTKRISLAPKKLTLEAGHSPVVLSAKTVFKDAKGSGTGVFFVSSNPKILRVDPVGNEKGETRLWPVRSGTARITAYCGDKKASCKVKIEKRYHADDIGIYTCLWDEEGYRFPACDSLEMTTGENVGLYAASADGRKSPYGTGREKITWKSSNEKVAEVNDGLVSAKAAGKARITLTWKLDKKTVTKTCEVTVTDAKTVPKAADGDPSVKLKVQTPKKVMVGAESAQEVVAALTGDGASERRVKFISSNPAILTFGEEGEEEVTVTPAGSGEALEARVMINPVAPGTASIIVESAPEGAAAGKVDREICRVRVSAEPHLLLVLDDTWEEHRSGSEGIVLYLNEGETTTLFNLPFPLNADNATNAKWTVKGKTVSVKNGFITAKKAKINKKTKEAEPSIVTYRIGEKKVEYTIYVL